jgi:hypothetical protein
LSEISPEARTALPPGSKRHSMRRHIFGNQCRKWLSRFSRLVSIVVGVP